MATTRIMPIHLGKSKSAGKAIETTIEYVSNPEKTDNGRLITTWECDKRLAPAEFLFTHQQYMKYTGRTQKAEDVVAYHLRQAFLPGEVTPEKANALGCELAGRLTKGNHAYIVCTHIDKAHIHNHIIWNAVDLTATRKFRNFWNSTKAVRQLSDTICIENGCSVIAEPKRKGKSYNKWLEENGKSGNLLVDIQAKLKEGKGAGYEHWAKLFNLKQMAKTIAYLQEYGISDIVELNEKAKAVTEKCNSLSEEIKDINKRMAELTAMRKHIIDYIKTRDVYVAYRKAGYSKKFLAVNKNEIEIHKSAKEYFNVIGLKKLPTINDIQTEWQDLHSKKNSAYKEYRELRKAMKELQIAKANIESILDDKGSTNKEKTR